ncbi:MAG TPA: PAS domain S-box protein [Chitinophagaceae bacterium]|nr:PAS domain S-box protein [Chitinophagaceae bacterium]
MTNPIQNIQNEEYYKLVADNINDLVALYSPGGILDYISPSIYRILGYDPGSLTGKVPIDIIHPDDHYWLEYKFALNKPAQPAIVYFEYRLKHISGRWIYFESYRNPIYDDNGRLVNILAVCRDISARKQAEQALRESMEYYRMLADNIIDMVAVYKPDGTTVYVSPSCYSLLGYTPDELLGKKLSDFVHPGDLIKFRDDVRQKAFKGIEKFVTEARVQHKNGYWLYCETTTKAMRGANGRVHSFVCTTRDISEWKSAQVALKESEEKYRSLVETSDAMIAIVDTLGRFLFVNDKRANFFNARKEDIVGKTVHDFYDKPTADDFNRRILRVFATRENYTYEALTRLNGKEYWLKVTMHPVLNSEGEISSIMVSTNDITDSKQKEETLSKQNDELKQIAFLQSHIVRSPLTNIQGIIALMEEGELNTEQAQYFNLLKQAAGALDDILKEIVARAVVVRHQVQNAE